MELVKKPFPGTLNLSLSQNSAETLALQALGWLAGNDEIMPVFLGSTGVSLDELKARAGEAEFLGSVLDFILMDDSWVLDCAETCQVPPERLMQARHALPGGEQINWT